MFVVTVKLEEFPYSDRLVLGFLEIAEAFEVCSMILDHSVRRDLIFEIKRSPDAKEGEEATEDMSLTNDTTDEVEPSSEVTAYDVD